ncbi:MAG: ABC transporter permease [Flavobacteriales bacterium]
MLKNYFKIAWRNLLKNKVYSLVNIGGLALGIAISIIIGLWVNSELSFNDIFENKSRIAQVWQSQTFNNKIHSGPAIPRPLEFALRENFGDNFEHIIVSTWTRDSYLKYQETTISREGYYMQENAPELLDLKILKGEKDGLRDLNSIMLSESTAKTIFDNEDPIGKILRVNNEHSLMVSAVYEDLPLSCSFYDAKYLIPWEQYVNSTEWVEESKDDWGNNSFQMFVQVNSNTTNELVSQSIRDIKKELNQESAEYDPQIFLLGMEDWHLKSHFEQGKQTGGRIIYVWLFGIIGLLVLILACINFMNLSTARSEKRAKEVGIRKSIGSYRNQLIYQFLSESFLVTLLAFLIGIIIVSLSLNGFNSLARKEIVLPYDSATFWCLSFIFILITSLLAGSYPALYLSSFKPVEVLKGTFKVGKVSNLPRKALVVFQFTVSVVFIIGTGVVLQQIDHAKNRPVGYKKEGLIQVPTFTEAFYGKTDLMRDLFVESGAIISLATSSSPTTQVWSNRSGFTWEGKPDNFQEDLAFTSVSNEYAQTLQLTITEGRDFSEELASDSLSILINESAKEYLGMENPIGKFLKSTNLENPNPPLKIIGIVEDIIVQSPYSPVKQAIYANNNDQNFNYYNLRLNPEKSASESIALIEKIYTTQFPNIPFEYDFIDEEYQAKFDSEERIGKLSRLFTAIAIIISCLGLFGLASFIAEQRTKEIGVRKVLGASIFSIWSLLSIDFLKLVLAASLMAIPISIYMMNSWLENYTYRIQLTVWLIALAIGGAIVITILTISFQALKAALTNPTESLRSE